MESVNYASRGYKVSIVKSIEVIAQSENSFDDAVKVALQEASKSVRGIQNIWVKDMEAEVKDDQISMYRVNAKVSFLTES